MKTKIKQLIAKGLSEKTIKKLSEAQINTLHKKLVNEAQISTTQTVDLTADDLKKGYKVPDTVMSGKKNVVVTPNPKSPGGVRIEPTTEEIEEDDVNVDVSNDPDATADGMGIFETNKKDKSNPWAICTAQMGKEFGTSERSEWSTSQKKKYERCVKDVKKSLKEGKNPVSLFLENEIMKIVERNLPPRITKGDLMKYLSEQGPAVAPTKPKPTTKPGKPATRPRPSHPGKNPNPNVKPAPKAVSPEKAKDKVIDVIINLLEK